MIKYPPPRYKDLPWHIEYPDISYRRGKPYIIYGPCSKCGKEFFSPNGYVGHINKCDKRPEPKPEPLERKTILPKRFME